MKYKDPVRDLEIEFKVIPSSELRVGKYQRDESSSLTKKILSSVAYGFIVPMIVVNIDDMYEIIDGQHRFMAMATLRPNGWKVPCVIVPETLVNLPLLLNIEKADTLKDKCTKIHKIYLDFLANGAEDEVDILAAALFQPNIITLGFALREKDLSSPSLVESLTKLLDSSIKAPLMEAVEIRRSRATSIANVERTVGEIADENEIRDYNLKRAILSTSKQALWGRKRTISADFEMSCAELIMKMLETDWSYLARY